jgi:mitofilin
VLFYGGSTYASLQSAAYADFFTENVPGGDYLVESAERSSWTQSMKKTDLSEAPSRAANAASAGLNRVTRAINRLKGEVSEKADEVREGSQSIGVDGKEALQDVRKRANDMVHKVEKKVDETDIRGKGEKAVEDVKEKSKDLVEKAKLQLHKAEEDIRKKVPAGKGVSTGAQPYGKPLPLQHEAPEGYSASAIRDRGVQAEPNDPMTRLRDPATLPSLPKLAPSLESLSGSEPMIAQLASTVDELAAFLRETPNSGVQARGVLDEAKKEFARLSERLEQIKKTEADKLKQGLESQKKKYDAELKKAADSARAQVGKIDEKWKKEQDALRKKEAGEYEDKLKKELATQSELINERLKEEVVSQGIEMQRRWMKEIKARVEAERGGRLAKLDELATDLGNLQKISLDNSQALEENASAIAVDAALRELNAVALEEQEEVGTKASFTKQLEKVKKSIKGKEDSDLLLTILQRLDASDPSDGVESFSTLYSWFTQKVRPAIQRVALVPEQAGILSHLFSSTVSPLLFNKNGLCPGSEDVPSVLARSQHHLERRDLDNAAREINQLKGWPKILAEDWLQAARKRLEVEQHVQLAQIEAHFSSLQTA